MKPIFRQNQLYTYLLYCNGSELEKKVLDCGAGGPLPPLAIFKEHGYETYGIDIDDEQIERAKNFEQKNQLNLNIQKGDMMSIPFESATFSFVYSYNTIFHMSKQEIHNAIKEIHRVMKHDGLCFINFASNDDERAQVGEKVGSGEYLQEENGDMVLHSYHDEFEAEQYFNDHGFEVIYKEVRKRTGPTRTGKITMGYIDYIVRKI